MNKTMQAPAIMILLMVVLINALKDLSDLVVTYVTNEYICPKKDKNKAISNNVIIIQLYCIFLCYIILYLQTEKLTKISLYVKI